MLILIRYNEIFLKGPENRPQFEKILLENIKNGMLKENLKVKILKKDGRIFLETDDGDKSNALSLLSRIFGIHSFSEVRVCEKDLDKIKHLIKEIGKNYAGSFKINSKRADKTFPLNRLQLNEKLAEPLWKRGLKVDLKNPDNEIFVEIRDNAYICDSISNGPGGLPISSGGKALGYLRNEEDLIANWLIMKRGTRIVLLKEGLDEKLLLLLQAWSVGKEIKIVGEIKRGIRLGAKALVDVSNNSISEFGLVVLNPLVGFLDEEKESLLKKMKVF